MVAAVDDEWGAPVAASSSASIDAWNRAWADALHFVGDPFATLARAAEEDEAFAMGSIFCGTYRLLGGAPADSGEVVADISNAELRGGGERERAHLEALELFAAGEFTRAAQRWDAIAEGQRDFAAVRFAHDVYLHVGNVADRLASSTRAVDAFGSRPGWNLVLSQHAFSLEEAGRYDDAEQAAWRALEEDPMDLWATHALAHVYESTEDQDAALDLLLGRRETWKQQDGLAVHIWWHLALRLMAAGEFDEVLAIHDSLVPDATTPFRLCDLASTLWRLELEGVDVGDRWSHLAEAFSIRPEQHTSGFLDLHMALTYCRQPDHPAAAAFYEGISSAENRQDSENAETFRDVVRPLVAAIRSGDADPAASVMALTRLEPTLHRIGGSIAQRDLIALTKANYERLAEEAT